MNANFYCLSTLPHVTWPGRDAGMQDWLWQAGLSHTHRACPHTHFHADKTLTALVRWCLTARVQPLARKHGFCERSQGKHLPHRTVAVQEQSGRRRRHCTRGRVAGNDFDVYEVCVQGVCSLSPKMPLHKVVCTVGVVNFFGSTRSSFCVIYLVSRLKTLTQVMWRRVRIELHYLTSELKRCSSPLARA